MPLAVKILTTRLTWVEGGEKWQTKNGGQDRDCTGNKEVGPDHEMSHLIKGKESGEKQTEKYTRRGCA